MQKAFRLFSMINPFEQVYLTFTLKKTIGLFGVSETPFLNMLKNLIDFWHAQESHSWTQKILVIFLCQKALLSKHAVETELSDC